MTYKSRSEESEPNESNKYQSDDKGAGFGDMEMEGKFIGIEFWCCAPYEIISATDKKNDVKKTEFILNACHCKYVPECKMLFDYLYDFIYNMYFIYRKKWTGKSAWCMGPLIC